ncbi:MAG: porin [Planctomycetota bacterium]
MPRRLVAAALLFGLPLSPLTPPAAGQTDDALRREVQRLRATVTALEDKVGRIESGTHADARESDRLRHATADALEDARQRISYQTDRLTAGHDGRFFLESPDGGFTLNLEGHLQVRYVANFRDNAPDPAGTPGAPGAGDDVLSGFTLRRTKLAFTGHLDRGRKFFYGLTAAGEDDFDDGQFEIESVVIGTHLTPDLKLQAGQFKLPFAREELISSKRQLGVDRSLATESFTLDFGQGVLAEYTGLDRLKLRAMVGDGADTENLDFDSDDPDVADAAFTVRIDVAARGKARDGGDVVAWKDAPETLLLGAAGHVQLDDSGSSLSDNFYTWTLDALYKHRGFATLAAFYALHTEGDDGRDDFDDYGLVVGTGYSLSDTWQPFVQFNHLDLDDLGDLNAVVVGVNTFFDKHHAKLTTDVVVVFDPLITPTRLVNRPGTTLGLLPDRPGEDAQVVFRTQFQLLF